MASADPRPVPLGELTIRAEIGAAIAEARYPDLPREIHHHDGFWAIEWRCPDGRRFFLGLGLNPDWPDEYRRLHLRHTLHARRVAFLEMLTDHLLRPLGHKIPPPCPPDRPDRHP